MPPAGLPGRADPDVSPSEPRPPALASRAAAPS
jgi:hypothetical protein